MRKESLGIDSKSGAHRKNPLTAIESAFVTVLWVDHVGRENCIPANDLAMRYAGNLGLIGEDLDDWKRDIRYIQNHLLIEHTIPVYSAAGKGGGYWIGESLTEGEGFYGSFRQRGLTGMVKASRGKKSALVDIVTQLSFEFDDLVVKAGMKPGKKDSIEAPVEIIDAFLRKMISDPEKYADGLRLLGEKYGSVLVPRERYEQTIRALKYQLAQTAELVSALEQ